MKKSELARQPAFLVRCPRCKAEPRKLCVTASGVEYNDQFHTQRLKLAATTTNQTG